MKTTTLIRPQQLQLQQQTEACCDCCGAVEGKPHPIRGIGVELYPMKSKPLMACQICLLHYQEIPAAHPKKIRNPMHPKTFFTYLFFTVIFVLVFSAVALAQPGLPGSPDQAPIDGGLGLLAAAGGAYAWKKLRDRKAE